MKRDWAPARAKVGLRCLVCRKATRRVEAAHVIDRRVDRYDLDGRMRREPVFVVEAVRVVGLCGPATDFDTCHGQYDRHQLDLLPYLDLEEQVQAVRDAGSIVAAYRRTTGESPT